MTIKLAQWLLNPSDEDKPGMPQRAARSDADGCFIAVPARIAGLLRRLQQARVHVKIEVPGCAEPLTSIVLSVNADEGFLLLDEVVPASGRALARQAKQMQVGARLQGVALGFTGTVLGHDLEDGVFAYRLALPDRMLYLQRRNARRLGLGTTICPVHLCRDMEDTEIARSGHLHDISSGGISILFKTTHPPQGWVEGEVWNGAVHLFQGTVITTDLEVRHISRSKTGDHALVGCRFLNLPRGYQRIVDDFVMVLERREAGRHRAIKR